MITLYNRYKKIGWCVAIIICAPLLVESYFLIIESVISPYDLFRSDFYHRFFLLMRLKRLIALYVLTAMGGYLFNRFGEGDNFWVSLPVSLWTGCAVLSGLCNI